MPVCSTLPRRAEVRASPKGTVRSRKTERSLLGSHLPNPSRNPGWLLFVTLRICSLEREHPGLCSKVRSWDMGARCETKYLESTFFWKAKNTFHSWKDKWKTKLERHEGNIYLLDLHGAYLEKSLAVNPASGPDTEHQLSVTQLPVNPLRHSLQSFCCGGSVTKSCLILRDPTGNNEDK